MGWYWVLWALLVVVFATIEIASLSLVFAMLAAGSLAGLIVSLTPAHWWWQIIIAAVVAVLLILAVRPPLLRALRRGGDEAKTNIDAILGSTGRVLLTVSPIGGQVKLANGETWSARLGGPDVVREATEPELAPETSVRVTGVDGATVIVTPDSPAEPPTPTESTP